MHRAIVTFGMLLALVGCDRFKNDIHGSSESATPPTGNVTITGANGGQVQATPTGGTLVGPNGSISVTPAGVQAQPKNGTPQQVAPPQPAQTQAAAVAPVVVGGGACNGPMCNLVCQQGGCAQTCNAGGSCNFTCSGGRCTQTCPAGSTSCNMTCSGGNCKQTCAGNCLKTCSGGNCS